MRSVVLVLATVVAAAATLFSAAPAFASALIQSLTAPLDLVNASGENALTIRQTSDVGKSRSSSGAVLIDNTGNNYTGLTVYTNADKEARQPLMRLEVDNPAWSEEVLYIHSDSTSSRGLIRLDSPAPEIEFVETDQPGAAGKFEIRVQHDAFQINSRRADDTTFENKIEMTHGGDWVLRDGTIQVKSGKPAQFHGGINVTGGCIAVDGVCMSAGNVPEAPAPERVPEATGRLELTAGDPRPIGCNSYTERGTMKLDHVQHRVWVCNGPERGWDYFELTD